MKHRFGRRPAPPRTAYMIFYEAMDEMVRDQFPNATPREVSKTISAIWFDLDIHQRSRYELMADYDQRRWKQEKHQFK